MASIRYSSTPRRRRSDSLIPPAAVGDKEPMRTEQVLNQMRANCGKELLTTVFSPQWPDGYVEKALVDRVTASFSSGKCDAAGLEEISSQMASNWNIITNIALGGLVEALVDFLFHRGSRDLPQNVVPILTFLNAVLKDLLPYSDVSEVCGRLARKVWGNRALVVSVLTFLEPRYPAVSLSAMKILLSFLNRSPAIFQHDGLFVLAQKNFENICKIAEESARCNREEHALYATRIASLLSCSRLIYSDRMVLTGPLYEAVTNGSNKSSLCVHLFDTLAHCSKFTDVDVAKEVYGLSIETLCNLCTAHSPQTARGTLAEEGQSTRLLYHLLDVLYVAAPRHTKPRKSIPYTHLSEKEGETPKSACPLSTSSTCVPHLESLSDAGDDCMLRSTWADTTNVDIPCFPAWPTDTSNRVVQTFFTHTETSRDARGWLKTGENEQLVLCNERNRPQYATNSLLMQLDAVQFTDIVYMAATLLVEYLRNADLIPSTVDAKPKMNRPEPHQKPSPKLDRLLTQEFQHLTDYAIIAEEKSIGVSKCLLAAYVPYFVSLFEHEPTRTHTNFDETAEIAELWVRYIYTFNENLIDSIEKATGLLRIADRFCQDMLIRDCEIYLFNHLGRENLYTIFELAAQCNAHLLVDACTSFALRQLPEKLMLNAQGIWWLRGHSMLTKPASEAIVEEIPFLHLTLNQAYDLVHNFFLKDEKGSAGVTPPIKVPGNPSSSTATRPRMRRLGDFPISSSFVPDAS